jgi:hypothetical protein
MKQKTIFVITVIDSKELEKNIDNACRPWGFYFKFSDAEEVVLENQSDIFEFKYDLAVIEEYSEGWFFLPKETWYKANFIKSRKKNLDLAARFRETKVKVKKISRPRIVRSWCNFAMG